MVKVAKRVDETAWVNQFFRHPGCDVRYTRSDLRAWKVSLVDIIEVGRSGVVVDGDDKGSSIPWWTIEGYTDDGELLHVSVLAATEFYIVEIIDVERWAGDE